MSAKFNPSDPVWFGNAAIGRNSLAKMLSQMCKKARLSTIYTSHCMTATSATVLKAAGLTTTELRVSRATKVIVQSSHTARGRHLSSKFKRRRSLVRLLMTNQQLWSYQRLNPCLPRLQELPFFQCNQGNHCQQQKSREKRQWPPCKFALSRQATKQRQLRTCHRGSFMPALSTFTAANVDF